MHEWPPGRGQTPVRLRRRRLRGPVTPASIGAASTSHGIYALTPRRSRRLRRASGSIRNSRPGRAANASPTACRRASPILGRIGNIPVGSPARAFPRSDRRRRRRPRPCAAWHRARAPRPRRLALDRLRRAVQRRGRPQPPIPGRGPRRTPRADRPAVARRSPGGLGRPDTAGGRPVARLAAARPATWNPAPRAPTLVRPVQLLHRLRRPAPPASVGAPGNRVLSHSTEVSASTTPTLPSSCHRRRRHKPPLLPRRSRRGAGVVTGNRVLSHSTEVSASTTPTLPSSCHRRRRHKPPLLPRRSRRGAGVVTGNVGSALAYAVSRLDHRSRLLTDRLWDVARRAPAGCTT